MDVIDVSTHSRTEMIDVTRQVAECVRKSGVEEGTCTIYVPHTTAAVTVNEGADPSVKADVINMLNRLVPFEGGYSHAEGNSAAHIKSTIVGVSRTVPIKDGAPALGTWQSIFFCEFDGPRRREIYVTTLGKA
ncbi:MAG: secondary thiamine-phosphate synthase enzyme YjbQ [Candidatus Eisenbacteria bacterium]|nr:secondary thiamine-phosphate synthase enzyme YjbQ [Candidatus Eisenbacteria bacterium]